MLSLIYKKSILKLFYVSNFIAFFFFLVIFKLKLFKTDKKNVEFVKKKEKLTYNHSNCKTKQNTKKLFYFKLSFHLHIFL